MKKCRLFQDAPCIILGTDLSSDLRAQNFNGLVVIRSANSSAEDFENYMRNGDVDVCIGKHGSHSDIAELIRSEFTKKKAKWE